MANNNNVSALIEQVRSMHSLGLYTSTNVLSCLTLSILNRNDTTDYCSHCEVYFYHADTLFENKEYEKAESVYRKALLAYKNIPKSKNKFIVEHTGITDISIKYKIFESCMKLKKEDAALIILESISQKQRPLKVSLALAKLYQKREMDRPAVVCYKEVLKRCPLALDCAIELLKLREHPNVVISMINVSCNLDWLPSFIKSHSFMLNKEYSKSVTGFESLIKRPSLSTNPILLYNLSMAFFQMGNYNLAIQTFSMLHLQDPCWLKGMDLYAYLLCEDKGEHSHDLEKLAMKLFAVSEIHPESWVAMGYLAKSEDNFTRAVYLAARATELDITCVQALLLKGYSLRMLGELKIAVTHFRQALKLAPKNLLCYSEIVNCYLEEKRYNEALTIAKNAVRIAGTSPNSLVLQAGVLLSNPSTYDKAAKFAERALSLQPKHPEAFQILSTIAQRQHRYADAIKLLKSAIQVHNNSNMHTTLADCCFLISKFAEAVDHYNLALSLDPNNIAAKQGLEKINGMEQTSNLEMDNDGENDHFTHSEEGESIQMTNVEWPHDSPWF